VSSPHRSLNQAVLFYTRLEYLFSLLRISGNPQTRTFPALLPTFIVPPTWEVLNGKQHLPLHDAPSFLIDFTFGFGFPSLCAIQHSILVHNIRPFHVPHQYFNTLKNRHPHFLRRFRCHNSLFRRETGGYFSLGDAPCLRFLNNLPIFAFSRLFLFGTRHPKGKSLTFFCPSSFRSKPCTTCGRDPSLKSKPSPLPTWTFLCLNSPTRQLFDKLLTFNSISLFPLSFYCAEVTLFIAFLLCLANGVFLCLFWPPIFFGQTWVEGEYDLFCLTSSPWWIPFPLCCLVCVYENTQPTASFVEPIPSSSSSHSNSPSSQPFRSLPSWDRIPPSAYDPPVHFSPPFFFAPPSHVSLCHSPEFLCPPNPFPPPRVMEIWLS